jgi:hypothetical protein
VKSYLPARRSYCLALVLLAFVNLPAIAQQPINSEAAVQPSAGHFLLREQFKYMELGRDPTGFEREVKEYIASTELTYGLTGRLALTAYVPVIWQSVDSSLADTTGGGGGGGGGGGHDGHGGFPIPTDPTASLPHALGSDFGLDDITIGFKWRVYKHDFGPIDTVRIAVLGALELPTGEDAFSSDSVDPIIGAAATYIHGRHGANASLQWKFNTGEHLYPVRGGMGADDALFYNASWLFRILPDHYEATTKSATYFILELNGIYETNGDDEILISPGIMYEHKHLAIELGVQLPIYQEMDHRPKTDFAVVAGIRLLF